MATNHFFSIKGRRLTLIFVVMLSMFPSFNACNNREEKPKFRTPISKKKKAELFAIEQIELLNKKIVKEPQNISLIFSRARQYSNIGNCDAAIKDYSHVLEASPDQLDAYLNRARCFVNLERYKDALADYSQVSALDSNNLTALIERGALRMKHLSDHKAAMQDFNDAYLIHADNVSLLAHRGHLFHVMKQYKNAIADFTKAIELSGGTSELHLSRALSYRFLRKRSDKIKENIISDLNRAVALGRFNPEAYYERAIELARYNKLDKALSDFNYAIRLNSDIIEKLRLHAPCGFYFDEKTRVVKFNKNKCSSLPRQF